MSRSRTLLWIATALLLVALARPAAASMDLPCVPVSRHDFTAILLLQAGFRKTSYNNYVASDGFDVDITGMREYCTVAGPDDKTQSLIVQVSGRDAYYSIAIETFAQRRDADRQIARLQAYASKAPGAVDHVVRNSSSQIVQISRISTP